MAIKNYPHPVLSPYTNNFDQTKAKFDIKISKKVNHMNYQLYCDVVLEEENFERLLIEEQIMFVVKISCSATRYRNVFQFNSLEYLIEIPATLLEKKVEISTFIVASKRIDQYHSSAFNKLYGNTGFTVFPGDVLAEGSEYRFVVDKRTDPLAKVPSIFTIVYSNNKKAPPMDVQNDGHKIVITLNKGNFNKYKNLKRLQSQYDHSAALTSSLFILPALTSVIESILSELRDMNDELEAAEEWVTEKESEHRWFKVINARLLDEGIKLSEPDNIIESSLVIAQKLLGDPLSNGLQCELLLTNLTSEGDSD